MTVVLVVIDCVSSCRKVSRETPKELENRSGLLKGIVKRQSCEAESLWEGVWMMEDWLLLCTVLRREYLYGV